MYVKYSHCGSTNFKKCKTYFFCPKRSALSHKMINILYISIKAIQYQALF